MLIEIQCPNSTCGEKLIVSDDKVGDFVTCSKCKKQVEVMVSPNKQEPAKKKVPEVPLNRTSSSKPKSPAARKPSKGKTRFRTEDVPEASIKKARRPATKRPATNTPAAKKPTRTGAKDKSSKAKKTKKRFQETIEKVEVPADALRGIRLPPQVDYSNVKPKVRDPYQERLDNLEDEKGFQRPEEVKEKCPKCGSVSNFGKCTQCTHVDPRYAKLHQPLGEMEIRTVGFQRWFTRSMADESTIKLMTMASHVLFGAVMAIISLFGVLAILEHAIAVDWGLTKNIGIGMLVGVFLFILFYVLWIRKGYEFGRSHTARLNWFQRPFWTMGLFYVRLMKWQHYDSRLKGRNIIKVRDTGFGDRELANLEGLSTCEVLDLQKTQVTDEGIKRLYAHKSLLCLVVRKTPVSHEAVFRLQQSMPRLWIWK